MLTRVSAKAAAVTASIVIGAGVAAAAATGSLPGQASTGSEIETPVNGPTTSTTSSTVKLSTNTTGDHDGPDVSANSKDLEGLCHAFAHNSDEAKEHSEAMEALEKAAGGKSNVTAFCQQHAAQLSATSTTEDQQDADADEQGADTDEQGADADHATTSTTEAEHEERATSPTTEADHEAHEAGGVSGS